jgi:hypothetical protein
MTDNILNSRVTFEELLANIEEISDAFEETKKLLNCIKGEDENSRCEKCDVYHCRKCGECVKCGKDGDCHSIEWDYTGVDRSMKNKMKIHAGNEVQMTAYVTHPGCPSEKFHVDTVDRLNDVIEKHNKLLEDNKKLELLVEELVYKNSELHMEISRLNEENKKLEKAAQYKGDYLEFDNHEERISAIEQKLKDMP